MAIQPGTRLGPYEILDPLGAGGMGEVYRARDSRLDRTVAVKVLPAHLSQHSEARQRLEREARAVSRLNHPNICTLHDVGRQGEIDYLVLELLEGQTLADRLRKGPLPLERALEIGIQVAGGLDRAHREGVLHRDLKPGNIFLTKTGAKLLDFGLAKAMGGGGGDPAVTGVPTVMSPLTSEGAIVGTFQYMSPEQLSGKEADARSDLFAFGLVLYEMLTGRKAFEGKTQATLIGAILHAEPPPLSSAVPAAPPALQRLLSRALAKDPDERWQTAADLGSELQWIAGGEASPLPARGATEPAGTAPSGASSLPGTGEPPSAAPGIVTADGSAAGMRGREIAAWGLAALALASAASLALLGGGFSPGPAPGPTLRASILLPEGLASFGDALQSTSGLSLSRNGSRLAFPADQRLWVHDLAGGEMRPILDHSNVLGTFWSADSRRIGFFADGKLKSVAAEGGPATTVCDAPEGRGGTWAPDGTIIFAPDLRTGLFTVPAEGGAPAPLTEVDRPLHSSHRWPWLLPGGNHVIYLALNHANPRGAETGIYVAPLEGGQPRFLTRSDAGPAFTRGHLLYMRSGSLHARPLDTETLEFTGEEILLARHVMYNGGSWVGAFDVGETGPLTYMSTGQPMGSSLTWFALDGNPGEELDGLDIHWGFRFSPDGRRLALAKGDPEPSLYVLDPERGTQTRLASTAGFARSPVWSPDGRKLAFAGFDKGLLSIFEVPVDGSGAPRLLHGEETDAVPTDWSSDGRHLLFDRGPPGNTQVWVLDLQEGEALPLVEAPPLAGDGRFSPDGRWIIYSSRETGVDQIYLMPFPAADRRWQVSASHGSFARWLPGGDRILFKGAEVLTSVSFRASGGDVALGTPEPLFRLASDSAVYIGWEGEFEPGPGGSRVLVSYRPVRRSTTPLTIVVNWTNELKRD